MIKDSKKKCSRCKVLKLKDDFYKNRTKNDGLNSYCKECVVKEKKRNKVKNKIYNQEYYKKNKEQIKEKDVKWRKENPEKIKGYNSSDSKKKYNREYAEKNKEYFKKYYEKKNGEKKNIEKRNIKYNYNKEYLELSEKVNGDIILHKDVAFDMFVKGISELRSYKITLVEICKKLEISTSYLYQIFDNRNSILMKTIDKYLYKLYVIFSEYYSID